MTTKQRELWERVCAYSFDDPDSAFPFTERLAKDNGWTLGFALRVVEEYRRFAFLAVVAGHPVSPSDPVDQAWHLHQLYSDSYWDDFNANVLGKTLSHQPTKGGAEETEKFAQWYGRTRESYSRLFGTQPPADIWPTAETGEAEPAYYTRVNHAEHWVVAKGRVKTVTLFLLLWAGTGGGLWLSGLLLTGKSPLNFAGSDFLAFYIWSLLILLLPLSWLVLRSRRVNGIAPDAGALHPYVLACLNDGPKLAVYAAISKLIHEGKLRQDAGSDTFSADTAYPSSGHPLEARLQQYAAQMGGGCSPESLCEATQIQTAAFTNELEDRQLWLTEAQYQRMRGIVAGILGGLVTLGVGKILIGLSRGKPVLFLVILTGLTAGLGLLYCSKASRRTSLGTKVLDEMISRCERANYSSAAMDAHAIALMVGVMGLAALPGMGMAQLQRAFKPVVQTSSDSGSSGCSTSSCGGGGSSCGGGGGCGGCGGS